MAGAIAHRFSNTMMVVLGRMERLEFNPASQDKRKGYYHIRMVDGQ
ncbi:MAG: hypothetical protein Q7U88_05045 [Desulfocapsaceae bacterium]|nr:hypothetical protein [Desulfocapsaceae bacterium]